MKTGFYLFLVGLGNYKQRWRKISPQEIDEVLMKHAAVFLLYAFR